MPVGELVARLLPQTVPDLPLLDAAEVPLSTPPPQNNLLWADYVVQVPGLDAAEAVRCAARFMDLRELNWTEERREKERTYDIRGATALLSAEPLECGTLLRMRLSATADLMVRPEQIMASVFGGAEPATITRTALLFDEASPAHDAWRRRGRFDEWP